MAYYSNIVGTTENLFEIQSENNASVYFRISAGAVSTTAMTTPLGESVAIGTTAAGIYSINKNSGSTDNTTIFSHGFLARFLLANELWLSDGESYNVSFYMNDPETRHGGTYAVALSGFPATGRHKAILENRRIIWEPEGAGNLPTVIHQSIEPLTSTATVTITNPGVDYFLKEIHYGSITAWTTGGTRTIQIGVAGTLNKFGGSTITSTSNSAGNHNIFNTSIFQAQKIGSSDTPILTYTNTGSAGGSMRVRLVWHKLVTIAP